MNKADLVEAVQRALDVGRRDATHYVEQLFAVLSEALARGERVKVNRFGLFVAKMRPARIGRDRQPAGATRAPHGELSRGAAAQGKAADGAARRG